MATALITGATGGLGVAIAEALAPTHDLLLAARPSARLSELCARWGAEAFPLDLGDTGSLGIEAALPERLDVLVHNAGVAFPSHLADSTVDDWRTTMQVNLVGAVDLTLRLLPALRAAQARVVFVNSGAGNNVLAGMASYSASKFALRAFADSLRIEEPLLRVTTVHPGRVATPMQAELRAFEGGSYDEAAYLRPSTVAAVIADVVAAPDDADLQQVVVRPRGHR